MTYIYCQWVAHMELGTYPKYYSCILQSKKNSRDVFFQFSALELEEWRFHYISVHDIWSGFDLHINQAISLSRSNKPKHWNFTFQSFVAGVPSRDLKKPFLSLILLHYIYPDRTRYTDPKYYIFINISSENKKTPKQLTW